MRKKAERNYLNVTGLAIGIQKISKDATAIGLTFTPGLLKKLKWVADQTRLTVKYQNKKMIIQVATDEDHFSTIRSKLLSTAPSGKGRVRFSKFPDWIASGNTFSRHANFRITQYGELEIIVPDELTTEDPKLFKDINISGGPERRMDMSHAVLSSPIDPAAQGHLKDDASEGWGGQVRLLTEGKKSPVTFTEMQFEAALDIAVKIALKHIRKAA